MATQPELEAELLGKDIRRLTETINWMLAQGIDPKAITEAAEKRVVLISERDRHRAYQRDYMAKRAVRS